MALSNDLLTQFAKLVKEDKKPNTEKTVYGTVVIDGRTYVKLDGSDLLTPVSSTIEVKSDERVTVMIKDHSAIITGNLTSDGIPVRSDSFEQVSQTDLTAINATIENLRVHVGQFDSMSAVTAEIDKLSAKFADLKHINAEELEAVVAEIEKLRVTEGQFEDLTTEDLTAINATIDKLKADVGNFNYISADKLKATYANIDFSNIGKAAMEYLYASSGLIEDVVIDNGTITGNLIGVTIKGDVIEGNSIIADKLVIRGEDGVYYKLNWEGGALQGEGVSDIVYYKVDFDGETYTRTETVLEALEGELEEGATTTDGDYVYRYANDVDYFFFCKVMTFPDWADKQLHGSIIVAKSITAEKVSVSDLVAFDATIAGFRITGDQVSKNRFNAAAATVGYYVNNSNGQLVASAEHTSSDYIPVVPGQTYAASYSGTPHTGDSFRWAVYKSDRTFIEGGRGTEYNPLTIPEGAAYMRYSFHSTQYGDEQLELGTEPTAYSLYFEDIPGAIYSGVKESVSNTTTGIYMGSDGQINIGDDINYIQYYRDADGSFKLAISAESIQFALNNGEYGSLADVLGHVNIGTYEDEPCIELGQETSDFKLIITNTRILFKQGEATPAYVSNQALNIDKAVVENELHIGDKYAIQGTWVWKTRSNGNLGLVWQPAFITFTVDGISYTAVPGMTWSDWCSSEYNMSNNDIGVDEYNEIVGGSGNVFDPNSRRQVLVTDLILEGTAYYTA